MDEEGRPRYVCCALCIKMFSLGSNSIEYGVFRCKELCLQVRIRSTSYVQCNEILIHFGLLLIVWSTSNIQSFSVTLRFSCLVKMMLHPPLNIDVICY